MKKSLFGAATACLLAAMPLTSDAIEIGVVGRGGTLGLGVDLTASLTGNLNARLGINRFEFARDATEEDIDYEIDVSLSSLAGLLDWYPGGERFRLTAGLLLNGNELELSASGDDQYEIGPETYDGNLAVDGLVDFRRVAPYVGIGWGKAPRMGGGWSFTADLGVMFQGQPELSLDASGTATRRSDSQVLDVSTDPQFQQDLAEEQQNLQDDLNEFELFPVFSLGLAYSF